MNIQKNSWHYKVYCWLTDTQPSTVNLCPYVRTVFIWAPLFFVFIGGKIGRIYVAIVTWSSILTAIPIIVAHYRRDVAVAILWGYLVGALAIGAALLIPYLMHLSKERRNAFLKSEMTEQEWSDYRWYGRLPVRLRRKRFKAISGAWDLLCERASAAHDKVCPILRVE